MKIVSVLRGSAFTAMVALALFSCQDKSKEAEAREENKVGNVYDKEQQGIEHENRDNQFPSSRNDNKEGTGLETGAPTDTIDNNSPEN